MKRHRNRAQAWALVSPRGRVQVDTVRKLKREAAMHMSEFDEAAGFKLRRVDVVVSVEERIR